MSASCLQVDISIASPTLKAQASLLCGCLSVIAERIGGITVNIKRYDTQMDATVSDIGKHLSVSCGIVCEVGDLHILKVSPEEIQWITPTQGVIYTVESNTNWTIITT